MTSLEIEGDYVEPYEPIVAVMAMLGYSHARMKCEMACCTQTSKSPPSSLRTPLVYLSNNQKEVVRRYTGLRHLESRLPGWVCHYLVAEALGHSVQGVCEAVSKGGKYLWATEFENVHSTWKYEEGHIWVNGTRYSSCEEYYQKQKPVPYDDHKWKEMRVGVMRLGLRRKFEDPSLRALLLSTHPHPLISVKADPFWGFCPGEGGQNMLGVLLVELRRELRETQDKSRGCWGCWSG